MKKTRAVQMSIAAFILFAVVLGGSETPPTHRQILDAIRHVESAGADPCLEGDGGRALGPYQIHYDYWREALEFDPSHGGSYEDCFDRKYAEKVVKAYMLRHAARAWKAQDAEVIARVHNGGPGGARKASTLEYWKKVKKLLAEKRRPPAPFRS